MRFFPARAIPFAAVSVLVLLAAGCVRPMGEVIQPTSTGESMVAITQPAVAPVTETVEFTDAQATLGILPADTPAPTEPAPTASPTIQLVMVTSTPQYITPRMPMAFTTPDTPAPTVASVLGDTGLTRTPGAGQPSFILPDSSILPTPTNLPGVEDECMHIIQPGDSLYLIAITYGFTIDELVLANPDLGDSSAVLQPGDPIRLPLPDCAEATEDPSRTRTPTPRATVTPTGTPPGTPGTQIHVVQPGDVLVNIAAQYGVTVSAIVAANDMSNPNALRVGQELIIPPASP